MEFYNVMYTMMFISLSWFLYHYFFITPDHDYFVASTPKHTFLPTQKNWFTEYDRSVYNGDL